MYKSYKYRIYPTQRQKDLMSHHFGCCRFVYNVALETKKCAYNGSKINLSRYDLQSQLVDLKKYLPWLKRCNSQSLQYELLLLDDAYVRFFKGGSFPKFKSKNNKQSFTAFQNVKVNNGRLFMPKFREGVKIILHRNYHGYIKRATITKTTTGKYFVSLMCLVDKSNPSKKDVEDYNTLGIDLGLKHFAVTSDGEVIENPRFLKNSISRLKVLQRRASRKQKGSNNRKKANRRVALMHEKIRNQRRDFLHKLSSRLVSENQTICLEDLAVKNMMKNRILSQSISDVGWREFRRMLEYKSDWYGTNVIIIDRFAPSSKTCECGFVNKDLKLSDRLWECDSCGRINDRDILAANNIKKFGIEKYRAGDARRA